MTTEQLSIEIRPARRRPYPLVTATILGFLAGYMCKEFVDPQDEATAAMDGMRALEHTTSCNEDPLALVIRGKTVVVADGRCRNDNRDIDVMRLPNEATTGPIATVETGATMEADCLVEGQSVTLEGRSQPTTDKWVHVILRDENGVTFKSNVVGGYVSAVDVVGDTSLPMCSIEENDTEI